MNLRAWIQSERQEFRDLFDRTVLRAVPRGLWAARPGGTGNSIVWLMWHLARVEDVAIHVVVRGRPPFLTDAWRTRLGVIESRIGTGLSEEEVAGLSRSLDGDGVLAYWQAVREATDQWLGAVQLEALDTVPEVEARLAAIPGIVGLDGGWLLDFWRGRSAAFFLRLPVINHGFLHLGQMQEIRGRLGIPGR